MAPVNRELVKFFLCHRLAQRDFPTSPLRLQDTRDRTVVEKEKASPTAGNGLQDRDGVIPPRHGDDDVEAVKLALVESADEFELLFTQAFNDLATQLQITPDTAYSSFKSVMDEVFKDGVNWGRIVGLFVFGGVLCLECSEKDMSELVPRIADWMTMYLDENINEWIESEGGGWASFAQIFGQDAAAKARKARTSMKRWFLFGAVVLTGVLFLVCYVKRR
ncbi:bcl-2-like protein 1 [Gouania willdenowi]|nr:bcl-2-like protein 1 [Gouania willdenowi]XP_028302959.1 bcl-2-like protein 1 [Gouania willdenowi]